MSRQLAGPTAVAGKQRELTAAEQRQLAAEDECDIYL
jgi:hypothetical protein